ncbi:MAG: kelch repeat-containing protein, partial [Planctomycetota bacterium]
MSPPGIRSRLAFALAAILATAALPARAGAASASAGEWRQIAKTGRSWGGATVYCPSRKQVLRWGGISGENDVLALDLGAGKWTSDYPGSGKKGKVGGGLYAPTPARWSKTSDRPDSFCIFRQACWDSKRSRMIIVAWNITAAYDPAARKWKDLKAAFDDGKTKQPGCVKGGAWFGPVPGGWGSCAYDPVNDEVLLFPLWTHLNRDQRFYGRPGGLVQSGPEQVDDAGVAAGHYGTFVFDCKTNTWRLPELGGKEMLAARTRLASLINAQREAARRSWKALIMLRREKKSEASALMKNAAEAQKKVNDRLLKERAELEKLAGTLKGYEAEQVGAALKNLPPILARADKAGKGLSAGKAEDLPALCSQQRAVYRGLRLVRKHDLYVQPIPRCETSVVYDSKNQVIVMAGGNHLDRLLNDTWAYDCKTRKWRRRKPAPEAAAWPG